MESHGITVLEVASLQRYLAAVTPLLHLLRTLFAARGLKSAVRLPTLIQGHCAGPHLIERPALPAAGRSLCPTSPAEAPSPPCCCSRRSPSHRDNRAPFASSRLSRGSTGRRTLETARPLACARPNPVFEAPHSRACYDAIAFITFPQEDGAAGRSVLTR